MWRLLVVSLLVASAVVVGAIVLGSASAAKAPGALSLQPQLRALERRLLKPSHVRPRVLNAPPAMPPRSRGFACPVSAGSPCSSTPCVVYIAPPSAAAVVRGQRPRPRLRSCIHKALQQIPVMAR